MDTTVALTVWLGGDGRIDLTLPEWKVKALILDQFDPMPASALPPLKVVPARGVGGFPDPPDGMVGATELLRRFKAAGLKVSKNSLAAFRGRGMPATLADGRYVYPPDEAVAWRRDELARRKAGGRASSFEDRLGHLVPQDR